MMLRMILSAGLVLCSQGEEMYGYQLHSYNDMRQWPAVESRTKISPGFTRLKIDPHYVNNKDFCRRHGFTTDYCLVLNHDTPSMSETYNTSLQLAAGLKMLPNSVIALCGKATDPCVAPAVLELFDHMMTSINSTVAAHNITIILDGAMAPTTTAACLWNRWEPWSSTWINLQDPSGAATSNDGHFGRFQVLNMKCCANSVEYMDKLNPPFGKFPAENKAFPFQLWEPSDEPTIRSVTNAYGKSTAGKAGLKLLFAINQDPSQLLNYVYSNSTELQESTTVISTDGTVFTYNEGHWGTATAATATTINIIQKCNGVIITYDKTTGIMQQLDNSGAGVVKTLHVPDVVSLQCGVEVGDTFCYITADGIVTGDAGGTYLKVGSVVQSGLYIKGGTLVYSNGSHIMGAILNSGTEEYVLGVGSDLKGAWFGTSLLLTATNGYCYNCEHFNKRATPRMCNQVPVPQPNVLTITLTTSLDLADQIPKSTAAKPMLHSCNSVSLHGSFGIGKIPVPTSDLNIYYMPLESVNSNTCPSECGCPVPAAKGEGYRVFKFPSNF